MARAMQGTGVETQGLLVPLSLELSPQQSALIEKVMPELNRNGFQIEPLEAGRSDPRLQRLPEPDILKLLSEILEGGIGRQNAGRRRSGPDCYRNGVPAV
jgi:DNA mismatch repair ATPase MutL